MENLNKFCREINKVVNTKWYSAADGVPAHADEYTSFDDNYSLNTRIASALLDDLFKIDSKYQINDATIHNFLESAGKYNAPASTSAIRKKVFREVRLLREYFKGGK